MLIWRKSRTFTVSIQVMSTSVVIPPYKGRALNKRTQWFITLWHRSFVNWRYRLLLHTGFWTFLLFFWLRENLVVHIDVAQHYVITLTGIALSLFLFYPLVYGIIPLLRRRRWIMAILLFIMYYLVAIAFFWKKIKHVILCIQGSDFSKDKEISITCVLYRVDRTGICTGR